MDGFIKEASVRLSAERGRDGEICEQGCGCGHETESGKERCERLRTSCAADLAFPENGVRVCSYVRVFYYIILMLLRLLSIL